MARLMYGNWERYCEKRYQKFGDSIKEGFSGSSIIMQRAALDKVGLWDERIQAADFDLYLRSKDRSLTVGDIKPMMLANGVYIHHYQRLTAKAKFAPFADGHNLISLQQKWGSKEAEYLKYTEE